MGDGDRGEGGDEPAKQKGHGLCSTVRPTRRANRDDGVEANDGGFRLGARPMRKAGSGVGGSVG